MPGQDYLGLPPMLVSNSRHQHLRNERDSSAPRRCELAPRKGRTTGCVHRCCGSCRSRPHSWRAPSRTSWLKECRWVEFAWPRRQYPRLEGDGGAAPAWCDDAWSRGGRVASPSRTEIHWAGVCPCSVRDPQVMCAGADGGSNSGGNWLSMDSTPASEKPRLRAQSVGQLGDPGEAP